MNTKSKKVVSITKLETEIKDIISHSPVKTDLKHAISARKWVLKLKPDADLALQISALAHDIERANEPDYYLEVSKDSQIYNKYREIHPRRSAMFVVKLLTKHGFDLELILKVENLILNHEIGGNEDSNILMDADSLSFFEENFEGFLNKYGEEKARKKIDLMYSRMSSKAKKMAKQVKFKNKKLKNIFEEEINEKN